MEKISGLSFGVLLPSYFEDYHFSNWKALQIVEVLKKEKIIKSFNNDKTMSPYSDEPKWFKTVIEVEGKSRIGYAGTGLDFFDRNKSLWPAVGEAVERYSLETYEPEEGDITQSSYKELNGNKLDIFSLAGYSDEFRNSNEKRFRMSYDETTKFCWVQGIDALSKSHIWIPLQLLSFKYANQIITDQTEPQLAPFVSTGSAAGQNIEMAVKNGIFEIIERDAFLIHWLNKLHSEKIKVSSISNNQIDSIIKIAKEHNLEIHLVYLRTDIPIHSVAAIAVDQIDNRGPAVTVGLKSGFDLHSVIHGAINEAVGFRSFIRTRKNNYDLDSKNTGQSLREKFWFKKESLVKLNFWINDENEKIITYFPTYNQDKFNENDLLEEFFLKNKLQAAYKDITLKYFKNHHERINVVMVRIPFLQPFYLNNQMPALYGERLKNIPQKIGLKSGGLNYDPLPPI